MAASVNLEGKSILLCEPNGMTLMLLRQALKRLGVTVIAEVQTGKDAITTALQHRPDYALIDFYLSDMDGIETARQILRGCPTCVIIVSTLKNEAIYQRAVEAGVQGILLKPFFKQDLIAYFQQTCPPSEE